MADMRDQYLWLMKQALTDNLRVDNEYANLVVPEFVRQGNRYWRAYVKAVRAILKPLGFVPMMPSIWTVVERRWCREVGQDWPHLGESMAGLKRLDNVQHVVETVIRENIPGDLLEAGVWRGGASILMQAVLKADDAMDRTLWLCDSFEGLPPPDPSVPQDADSTFHMYDMLAVSEQTVRDNFARYDLLHDNLRFVKGYFEDTLATVAVEQLAVLRMDGDMYSSTMATLNPLYEKISPGGFIIVDDYGIENCRQAVHEFRDRHGITEEIEIIDQYGAFWRKG